MTNNPTQVEPVEGLAEQLINCFIATRTPAAPKTPDWLRVRASLECELFARAIPMHLTQQAEEIRDLNKRLAVANAFRMDAEEEVARLRRDLDDCGARHWTKVRNENARLRRIVKGWADWYRLAEGDPDCEYLNGKGWDDAEALADMSLSALNEQPGGEG